jgi:tRNA(Ile)-lysidine synthetase-like protein
LEIESKPDGVAGDEVESGPISNILLDAANQDDEYEPAQARLDSNNSRLVELPARRRCSSAVEQENHNLLVRGSNPCAATTPFSRRPPPRARLPGSELHTATRITVPRPADPHTPATPGYTFQMDQERDIRRPNPRDARLELFAERAITARRLLPRSKPLLVAVSGGPDSVALLHFLAHRRGLDGGHAVVVAGHVNHRLRGEESEGDAAFVRELAVAWGLAHLEETAILEPGASEEVCRRARYDALRNMAGQCGANRIATGHTADDQAETVLLRLARGAGLRGLSGMPARGLVHGVKVVRPILGVTREQVLDYLGRHGLEFRTDSTNLSSRAARNFVRREIVPRMRERVNPRVREAILRAADVIREANTFLEAEARRALPKVIQERGEGEIRLDAGALLGYPKTLRTYLLRLAVLEVAGTVQDLATTHINSLLSLLRSGSGTSVDLPGDIRARRVRDRIVLARGISEQTTETDHPKLESGSTSADLKEVSVP